jgi:hypothetical protein
VNVSCVVYADQPSLKQSITSKLAHRHRDVQQVNPLVTCALGALLDMRTDEEIVRKQTSAYPASLRRPRQQTQGARQLDRADETLRFVQPHGVVGALLNR